MRRLIQGGLALPLLIVLLSATAASVQFTPLVVINEVAWVGAAAEAIDEWIELYNNTDQDLDLTGWKLKSHDGWLEISLSGTISARGFFLLERSHDNVISNIPADQVYQGILRNSGERLYLYDPKGNLIDTANGNGGNWPAGTDAYGSPPYASMERIHSKVRDSDENWTCNDGVGTNGHDAQGNPVRGTPKAPNSAANLPPIADFSFQPGDPTTQDKIQFTDESSDPDGEIARWDWGFGDGTNSSEQNPQHRYGDDGTYTVQLTVADCHGAPDEYSQTISVANVAPTAAFSRSPEESKTHDAITFDASASSDPDGEVTEFAWDFDGDGLFEESTASAQIVRSFADDGTYTVALRITDDDGASAKVTRVITILNRPPQAAFALEPEEPTDLDTIRFNDVSLDADGEIAGWLWEFGDGATSEVRTPSHRYADDGEYAVKLTVTDDDGGKASSAQEILVGNAVPAANFSFTPVRPTVDEPVQFSDLSHDPSPAGYIVFWGWDFGDGTELVGRPNPIRQFSKPGTYTVVLAVIDDDGAIGRVAQEITVAPH